MTGLKLRPKSRPRSSGGATDIATLHFNDGVDDNAFWNFGTLSYGVSATQTIQIQYWGAQPASGVTFSGISAPFSILSNTCAAQVTQDCQLVIGYTGAAAGTFQENLKVTYDNGSYAAEDNFALTVVTSPLVIPATLSISDGATDSWGQVLTQQSYDKTFQVTISRHSAREQRNSRCLSLVGFRL